MTDIYTQSLEFAQKYITPYSESIDKDSRFPEESFKEMGKQEYFKLLIPKEYGGLGKGLEEHAEVCMAFAQSCATAGLCYMMHNVALMCILNYGSEELKRKIFADIIENEKFIGLGYSEFATGTHFYIPEIKASVNGSQTTFNGYKSMVTSATYAAYYLVLTPSKIEGQINNWILPLESEGLTFELSKWNGLGMRGNVSCPMKIENVTLDEFYKIGAEGSGLEQVLNVVAPFFITGLASIYSGVCLNVSDVATNYATTRKYPDGTSLSNIETVQIHLANIYTKAQAAKYLTLEAARSGFNGEADAILKILSARILASESSIECSRIAMRVGGGKAYNKELPIERLLRDSFAGQIMAPSLDVLMVWLGKALTGQSIP